MIEYAGVAAAIILNRKGNRPGWTLGMGDAQPDLGRRPVPDCVGQALLGNAIDVDSHMLRYCRQGTGRAQAENRARARLDVVVREQLPEAGLQANLLYMLAPEPGERAAQRTY